MEVWLLGLGALVLIALTVWIVWPSSSTPAPAGSASADEYDDRFTSATADLSAGGVAVTVEEESEGVVPPASPVIEQPLPESEAAPVSEPARTAQPLIVGGPPPLHDETPRGIAQPPKVGIVTAAALTLAGAIGGAWLYARWRQQRERPIRRLRRKIAK